MERADHELDPLKSEVKMCLSSLKLLSGICHNDKTVSNMNKYDGKFCNKNIVEFVFVFQGRV